MTNQVSYDIETVEGLIHLTITPVNNLLPDGNYLSTGIYKLSYGVVGMGEIIFEDDMEDWTYNGMDELTYEEAAEIAEFIKNYEDPSGSDPALL